MGTTVRKSLVTTNQFHHRVLPPNPGLPVSPNVETLRRREPPPKHFTVILNLQFTGSPSGHLTSLSRPNLQLADGGVHNWNALDVAAEGWPLIIDVDYFPFTTSLQVSIRADYGAGFVPADHSTLAPFDGVTPYDSGPLPWTNWTGQVVIFTQGEFIP